MSAAEGCGCVCCAIPREGPSMISASDRRRELVACGCMNGCIPVWASTLTCGGVYGLATMKAILAACLHTATNNKNRMTRGNDSKIFRRCPLYVSSASLDDSDCVISAGGASSGAAEFFYIQGAGDCRTWRASPAFCGCSQDLA